MHVVAVVQAPLPPGGGQRDRQRGGRGVREPADDVQDFRRVEREPLPHRVDDPAVGLMEDEQVDVVERQPARPAAWTATRDISVTACR